MLLTSAVRHVLSPLFRTSKRVINRFAQPVLILIYHRVTTLASDPQMLAVTPDNFRQQMNYLKGNYSLARLEDDWSLLPKPGVIVTFDDGYADNALEALPILEEIGVPATFFVTTSMIGTHQEFWWDELERVILGKWDFSPFFELSVPTVKRWSTQSELERERLYRDLHPILKVAFPESRESYLEQLRRWAYAGKECRLSHRIMNHEELRRLAQSPLVTIGAHTSSHSTLSALSSNKQLEELVVSKAWLEEFLNQKVNLFSYPFGSKGDYTSETIGFCRDAGFTKAVANSPGQWRSSTDLLQLPRNLVRNWDCDQFKKKMEAFWSA